MLSAYRCTCGHNDGTTQQQEGVQAVSLVQHLAALVRPSDVTLAYCSPSLRDSDKRGIKGGCNSGVLRFVGPERHVGLSRVVPCAGGPSRGLAS